VRCKACGRDLVSNLQELPASEKTNDEDEQDHLPPGFYRVSDGGYFTGSKGQVMVNVDVADSLVRHPDWRRTYGCCGSAGDEGPNLLCACGSEVATLKSDCWMPRVVLFEVGAVVLVGVPL
jgi:hypothetical protein